MLPCVCAHCNFLYICDTLHVSSTDRTHCLLIFYSTNWHAWFSVATSPWPSVLKRCYKDTMAHSGRCFHTDRERMRMGWSSPDSVGQYILLADCKCPFIAWHHQYLFTNTTILLWKCKSVLLRAFECSKDSSMAINIVNNKSMQFMDRFDVHVNMDNPLLVTAIEWCNAISPIIPKLSGGFGSTNLTRCHGKSVLFTAKISTLFCYNMRGHRP